MIATGLGSESRSHDAYSVNSQVILTPALQARHDRLKNTECLKYMKHFHVIICRKAQDCMCVAKLEIFLEGKKK